VVDQIAQTPYQQLHMVIGMVKDKDISKVLNILPKQATYYFCQAAIPRALPAEELMQQGNSIGLKGQYYR
jgi:dihydrofolate synthase/folylpolyglutamate synthase